MKRVVMESPLSASDDEGVIANMIYADKCMADCLARDESPLASHLLLTRVLDDARAAERKLGIAAGHAWIVVADAVVVYVDRGISKGMKEGIRVALAHGIPVEHRSLQGMIDAK